MSFDTDDPSLPASLPRRIIWRFITAILTSTVRRRPDDDLSIIDFYLSVEVSSELPVKWMPERMKRIRS